MPVAPQFLVDTSAWVSYVYPEAAKRLDEMGAAGELATCGLVELDLLSGLQDAGTYDVVTQLRRRAYPVLDMRDEDLRRALAVQALLVAAGEYSVSWAVLLVAAVAERHEVGVLHGNRRFTLVGKVTGQAVKWVMPPWLDKPEP